MTTQKDRVDELYRLRPEEFTASRDRLARELTDAGDRETAKAVKALRRPTTAAWAVNQVARRKPDLIAALFDAAARLRAAQRRAATGLSADDYREAMAERRRVVRLLTEEAEAVLTEDGRASDQHVAAAGRTFEAAAGDEAAAEALRAGRVTTELAPAAGFDAIDAFSVIPGEARPEPAAPVAKPTPADKKAAAARRELAAAEREVERQTRRVATAREEARAAERDAQEAEREVRELERQVERARRRLEEAQQRGARATRKVDQAEKALGEAEAKAAELRGGVTGAR
ncbi:MAG TPA: hypothetical protein VHH92_04235 [Actinomycetota bacterium]|nr:hypothetical protein [Actinomycetota bacterium]